MLVLLAWCALEVTTNSDSIERALHHVNYWWQFPWHPSQNRLKSALLIALSRCSCTLPTWMSGVRIASPAFESNPLLCKGLYFWKVCFLPSRFFENLLPSRFTLNSWVISKTCTHKTTPLRWAEGVESSSITIGNRRNTTTTKYHRKQRLAQSLSRPKF